MSALLELAERCEKAAGPDRELDALIFIAREPDSFRLPASDDLDNEGDPPSPGDVVCLQGFVGSVIASPRYTASIDKAATVVPKDYAFTVSFIGIPNHPADARVWLPAQKGHGVNADCYDAATPALALCAAALRARAAIAQPSEPRS